MGLSFAKDKYATDCVGRNPTDRAAKATNIGALVDEKGILIELSRHRFDLHDTQTAGSIIQNARTPIVYMSVEQLLVLTLGQRGETWVHPSHI